MFIRLQHRLLFALVGIGLAFVLLDARAQELVGPFLPIDEPLEDPFPIRRVLLPKDRLAAELERVKQGILVRLTRKEFEERVRQASRGLRQPVAPPRLLEATYHAKLLRDGFEDNALEGTAEWKIIHNGTGPALLPLDSLQIALKEARWTDNRSALIGFLDPKPQSGMSLLVEEPGQHSLALEWSSRGIPEPGELRFDLTLPTSPIASMSLSLPKKMVPILLQDEPLLSGPFPIDGDERRQSWLITLGGLTHLELSLRPTKATGPAAPILTTTNTRQDVFPGFVQQQSTFEFRVARGDVSELFLEYDPELAISEITVLNLDSWNQLPDLVNGRKRIAIRLREPARGGQLRISGVATRPFQENAFWISPSVQIVDSIPRGEVLRLKLSPEINMVEWRPGSFRLLKGEFAPDRSQVLNLEAVPQAENLISPTRPSARFKPPGTEYQARQTIEWNIAAAEAKLTSWVTIDVTRGTLGQIGFRLPNGWEVDRVDMGPRDPSPHWTLAGGILRIDPPKPLVVGQQSSLTIRLRQPAPPLIPRNRLTLTFPDLVPLGAQSRQGEYRVRVSPAFRALAPTPFEEPNFVGPVMPEPSGREPSWIYPFNGQPPLGPLLIAARTFRFSATTDSTVSLDTGKPSVTTRLGLRPESGAASSIVFQASVPPTIPWHWKTVSGTNQVLAVQPLSLGRLGGILDAATPFDALKRLNEPPAERWWRMTFARPLDAPLEIETTFEAARPAADREQLRSQMLALLAAMPLHAPVAAFTALVLTPQPPPDRQSVPLLRMLGAAAQTGAVTVQTPDEASWTIATSGLLRESVRQVHNEKWTTFQQVDDAISMKLIPSQSSEAAVPPRIDGAELTTVVSPSGPYRCLYRFRIRNGPQPVLAVTLPAGAKVEEISIAGSMLPVELCQIETRPESTECSFPVPDGPIWRRVEILYTIPAEAWTFSTRLLAPIPKIQIASGETRIVWRLPPGIAPVTRDDLSLHPGGSVSTSRLQLPWLSSLVFEKAEEMRPRNDADAFSKTSPKQKTPPTGTRTFQQLLIGPNSLTEKPILDLYALAEKNLQAKTPIPGVLPPTWDSLGLILLSVPGGTVLTTPRQQSTWRANSPNQGGLPPSVRDALDEAMRNGRDTSGRFRTVDDWHETAATSSPSLLASLGGDGPGWTEWETKNLNPMWRLHIANTKQVAITGWLAAALLLVIGIRSIGRYGRRGGVLMLFWLFAASSALLWLPTSLGGLAVGPMLAGLAVALVSACRKRPKPKKDPSTEVARRSTRQQIAVLGSLLFLAIFLARAGAQAPEPATVYLVLGPNDAEPKAVLVSPELLERLSVLAKPRLALLDSVILRAKFVGRGEVSGVAEFEAHFDLTSFVEKATITLPLGDVRLREALLDGAAAFPKTVGNDRFTIDVKGKGDHRLNVKFTVPINGTGPDREVRFGTPELAICKLEFTGPPEARQLRSLNWRGAQQLTEDGKELRADLGRARSIQVRWHQPGFTGNAQSRVQEAAVWDIDPAAATLFAAFDYKITQGSVSSFKISLPSGLEVSRLEVRPESPGIGTPLSWIRDWSVNPNRVLTIDLQAALTGNVRVLLEAVPVRQLSTRPILQFPTALEVIESEAYLAYRLRGLSAVPEFERRGVTEFSIDSFMKDIWRPTGAEKTPTAVTRAFRKLKSDIVLLRPVLQLARPASRAHQELVWKIGPQVVEVRGSAHWVAASEPLTFVEWEVPASVSVRDVRGVGLQSWSRAGNRVQVWLNEPQADVALIWHGSMQRGGPAAETSILDLPPIRLEGAATTTTMQRLRAPEGWSLSAENPAALGEAIPPLADREMAGQLAKAPVALRLQLRGPQPTGQFRIFSSVEVIDQQLQMKALIEPSIRRDRPHSFIVSVKNAQDWEVTLQAPPVAKTRVLPTGIAEREWRIEVPSRESDGLTCQLDMRRVLTARQEITLPEINIRHGEQEGNTEERLVLIGPELRERLLIGYLREAKESPITQPEPRERLRERGGILWRKMGGESSARLIVSPTPIGRAPTVKLVLADLEAAQLGDRGIERASFDLIQENGATLACKLPRGARLEGAALDGIEFTPSMSGDSFAIPLPGEGDARLLQLVWTTREPRWESPHLENAGRTLEADVVLWSAAAAAGDRINVNGAISSAAIDLRRAEILGKIAADRSGTIISDDAASRLLTRASRWQRLADANLNGPKLSRTDERGPDGQPLADWSTHLRERLNTLRAERPRNEPFNPAALRESTFEKLLDADAFRSGVPTHWTIPASGPAPEVRVEHLPSWSPLPVLGSFTLVALALMVLGLLMLLLRWVTRPEQVAILGVLAAVAFGFPEGYLFLSLTVAGLLYRFVWAGTRVARWIGG
ncbi:MAG: hypothetical protein K8T89_11365 [Planctomycetes bacterium]|nr:hypothetical protein [Planctomycetota bacterium]